MSRFESRGLLLALLLCPAFVMAGCAREDGETDRLTIVTGFFPAGQVSIVYSQTAQAEHGAPPYTWSLGGGGLPAGLSLDSASGEISGTPTTLETADFTLCVTDAQGGTDQKAFSITVTAPPLTITTKRLPEAVMGSPYSQTLQVIGGSGSPTWSVLSGSPPSGLTLNPTSGVLSGTVPAGASPTAFTVQVVEGLETDTQRLAIELDPVGTLYTSVIQDGTGDYTTIGAALASLTSPLGTTHVIRVLDDQVYQENVTVNITTATGQEWLSIRSGYDHFPTVRAAATASPVFSILSSNVEVRGFRIEGATASYGIDVSDSVSGPFTVYVVNCVITGNQMGFHAPLATGLNLLNNTFHDNPTCLYADGNPSLYNNVFSASGPRALRSASCLSDYNLFHVPAGDVGSDGVTSYTTLAQWQTGMGVDANSLLSDPLFVDAPGGDLHVQAGSPAEDNATTGFGAPVTDAEGAARGTGFGHEIGAFERP